MVLFCFFFFSPTWISAHPRVDAVLLFGTGAVEVSRGMWLTQSKHIQRASSGGDPLQQDYTQNSDVSCLFHVAQVPSLLCKRQ